MFHLAGLSAWPTEPVSIGSVNLLGVRVSASALLDYAEHVRRQSIGLVSVTDPALLERLLEAPVGRPVTDPVMWAETALQPLGVVERGNDGYTMTRLLVPPLLIHDVVVVARPGRELLAVQQASLFSGFAARWVRLEARPSSNVLLEAKLCGVGLGDLNGSVFLEAERPECPAIDGWAWLLWEKAYRRWLREHSQEHAMESQVLATGVASGKPRD